MMPYIPKIISVIVSSSTLEQISHHPFAIMTKLQVSIKPPHNINLAAASADRENPISQIMKKEQSEKISPSGNMSMCYVFLSCSFFSFFFVAPSCICFPFPLRQTLFVSFIFYLWYLKTSTKIITNWKTQFSEAQMLFCTFNDKVSFHIFFLRQLSVPFHSKAIHFICLRTLDTL